MAFDFEEMCGVAWIGATPIRLTGRRVVPVAHRATTSTGKRLSFSGFAHPAFSLQRRAAMTARTKSQRQHWARHHRVLAALLIAVIVLAVGLLIAQDQETLRIRSSLSVEDPRFPPYLANLLGHRLTSNDSYVVRTNGEQAFPAMLAAIDHAKGRIALETYIYEAGDVGRQFADALEAAAKRGVRVRIVLDSLGSKKMSDDDEKRLETAGAELKWVNPIASFQIEEANYRTHRKALVVDGEVAFIGGMGIADQWLHDQKDFPTWRDTMVEMHGPVVADVEAAFNQNWIVVAGIVEPEIEPNISPATGTAKSIVVWSAPQTGANELKLLYLLAIGAARHSIDIESPYLITDESSKWSIQEARRRGVRVRLLVEGDMTDAKAVKYAGRGDYEQLLEQGVEIAEYQPTMLHTKAMVVDGLLSIVGSANFDNRSLELNDELNVAVFDRALAARLLQDFERDLTQSKTLDLESWRQRSPFERGRDWLWSYFGEVF
jgi:cardiolipin synthase